MKKYFLASLRLAIDVVSTGAMAQAYLRAGLGASHEGIGCAASLRYNMNGTSYRDIVGYKFDGGFAGELGYIDFGDAIGFDSHIPDVDAKLNAKAWTLGMAYELPIAVDFSGGARIGIASMKTRASALVHFPGIDTVSVTESKTEAYYGVGGELCDHPPLQDRGSGGLESCAIPRFDGGGSLHFSESAL